MKVLDVTQGWPRVLFKRMITTYQWIYLVTENRVQINATRSKCYTVTPSVKLPSMPVPSLYLKLTKIIALRAPSQ